MRLQMSVKVYTIWCSSVIPANLRLLSLPAFALVTAQINGSGICVSEGAGPSVQFVIFARRSTTKVKQFSHTSLRLQAPSWA